MEFLNLNTLVQLAYFFTLLSYSVQNMFFLRVLALPASAVVIYYGFAVGEEPLWIPIFWNTLYLLVNAVQLLLVYWRRRRVALTPLEEFVSKTVLMNFPPREVKSFVALTLEAEVPVGQQLIQAQTKLEHLFCVIQGRAEIFAKEKKVAELGPGRFVGEMSLLTHSLTRADVFAGTELKLLVWPHEDIERWVGSDAGRLNLLQTALGTQVVEELLRQQGPNSQQEAG